jgi:hypothetical protein
VNRYFNFRFKKVGRKLLAFGVSERKKNEKMREIFVRVKNYLLLSKIVQIGAN